MTRQGNRSPSSTVTTCDHSTELVAVNRVAAVVKEQLRRGESPDLVTLLAENPELKAYRSIFLDLAHDEFCRRIDAGETVDTDEFCRQFPSFQNSLCMLIEVDRLLCQDPQFQSECDEPVWPKPEESFLGYSLIAEIGRGSFARVFLASEPALGGRLVVLKVAPHGGGEAEVAGKLRHPNIVPIHSIKEDPRTGLTAICMPYLGRTTLCDVLDHAFADGTPPVDAQVIADTVARLHDNSDVLEPRHVDRMLCRGSYVDAVLHLAIQLADALAYTHTRGICHRDLKPSNILLSMEGRPLLLDFNLSADENVNAWHVGGTLPYMAPEQLRDVAHGIDSRSLPSDPRSDLFSLGVIVYQMLCGSLPFGRIPQGSSIGELAEQLLEQYRTGLQPLRDRNRQVDRHVERLIARCLAFNPDDRPQSAGDLASSFRQQLTRVRRTRRWARNHPLHVMASAAIVLMLIAGGSVFLALRDPYSVRQFKQGVHYAEQGQYQLAIQCLDNSLEAEPLNPEFLFARGRARLKLGLYDSAAADFHQARTTSPDGKLEACRGFCATNLNQYKSARLLYCSALESGFQTPGLLNNLGHACIQLDDQREADRYLQEAIQMAPDLQAAHNNLLILHAHNAVSGEPVTESMLTHARCTIKTAEHSGELYYYAALLFSRAGKQDPQWTQSAKEYLLLSVAHRMDPKTIAADRQLSILFQDPQFQTLRHRPASKQPPAAPSLIVDPLENR